MIESITPNTLLQVNATIIAGILIFLTFTSLASNDVSLSQNPILPALDSMIESYEESLTQSVNTTSTQNTQSPLADLYNIRQGFELQLKTERMWEQTSERVVILTVTGISLAPFVISSALILGNSDRMRWARNSTKYGLIVVIIALVAFQGYYLVEVYNAREFVRDYHEILSNH